MDGYKELSDRQLQLRLLSILEAFQHLCNQYDLRFSLSYGTLLGAVRHKGYNGTMN